MIYTKGHISATWSDSYKSFPYVRQPIKDSEIAEWQSQGYTHDSFSGVMYSQSNKENIMPEWVWNVADTLELKNPGFVFYKMCTLEIMPVHSDHFETYCRVFNVSSTDVYRAIIFLEDWRSGHYFEINNIGVVNWCAGDYYLWNGDTPHAASNIGILPRYTLQITGTK